MKSLLSLFCFSTLLLSQAQAFDLHIGQTIQCSELKPEAVIGCTMDPLQRPAPTPAPAPEPRPKLFQMGECINVYNDAQNARASVNGQMITFMGLADCERMRGIVAGLQN